MQKILTSQPKTILLIFATAIFIASTSDAVVKCDKFKLEAKITGSTISLSVDTDLPDNTVVMVGVSRSYFEKGKTTTYSSDYFSEKSTVGIWRLLHMLPVDNEKWIAGLRAKQKKMSRLGLGFDVASISDKITVRMVVPINQPDPLFGKGNSALTGSAVRTNGLRVVVDEIEIDNPMDSASAGKSPFPNLHPLQLEIGQKYIVTKRTPLMPIHAPSDPFAGLNKMKQIPGLGGFEVIDTIEKKGNPWYKVRAFDQRRNQIGTGWINSTALLGQELSACK